MFIGIFGWIALVLILLMITADQDIKAEDQIRKDTKRWTKIDGDVNLNFPDKLDRLDKEKQNEHR